MPCPVIQKNTTILPSPGADLTVLIPAGLLALPRASLQGGGQRTTGAHPNPRAPLLPSRPQCSLQPILRNTAFLFSPPLVDSGAGKEADCRGTQPALLAIPLPVLRHAALCRLALPNFCLKLNLKERKKWKGQGSLCPTGLALFCQSWKEGTPT